MEVARGSCGEDLSSVTTSWLGPIRFSGELAIGTSVTDALEWVDKDPSLGVGMGSRPSSMGETAVEGTNSDEWHTSELALEEWQEESSLELRSAL